MRKKGSRNLNALLMLLGLPVAMLQSCFEEKNPYLNDQQGATVGPSSSKDLNGESPYVSGGGGGGGGGGGNAPDSGGGNAPDGGGGGNTPDGGGGPSLDLNATLDLACSKLAGVKIDAVVSDQIAILCSGGKATSRMKDLIKIAYGGSGSPTYSKITLGPGPAKKLTELVGASAIRYPLSFKKVRDRVKASLTPPLVAQDVTTITTIVGEDPPVDATYRECYKLNHNIKAAALGITVNQNMVTKECYLTLSEKPGVSFAFRDLVAGDPANAEGEKNGEMNKTVKFIIEAGDNLTYGFAAFRLLNGNRGLEQIAETKMDAQPPALAKAIYDAITAN